MNQKKVVLTFLMLVTLVGFGLIAFESKYLAMIANSSNAYTSIESYELQNGLSQEEINQLTCPKYVLLYDGTDELSQGILKNLKQVLDYAKKPYEVIEASQFKNIEEENLGIIICFENLEICLGVDVLFKYVEDGGSLLFAVRPLVSDQFASYQHACGIQTLGKMSNEAGIHFASNILIKAKDFYTSDHFIEHSSLRVNLLEGTILHATSASGVPILWENQYGKGRVVVNNNTLFYGTKSRGYVIGVVSLMQDDFIYPVINAKVNFIDDFPAPIPNGDMSGYYNSLDLSIDQFYSSIWWPTVNSVARKYNMRYSGFFIETYNEVMQAPFTDYDTTIRKSMFYFGQELVQSNGEIGLHGYNHQSFTYDQEDVNAAGYKAWKNEQDVRGAWDALNQFVKSIFPNYNFRTYVAPSNILSREIRERIPVIAPWVKVICGLYGENAGTGTYNQEFQVAEDGIIEFPRISSGYLEAVDSEWDIYNGISLHGVISHFIHPDDVLSEQRNAGQTWEGLSVLFEKMWKQFYTEFRWLRPLTVSEAAEELKKFLECEVHFVQTENNITGYCNNFRKDMYFILRTDKIIESVDGCSVEKIDENVYLVYATNTVFKVYLKEAL